MTDGGYIFIYLPTSQCLAAGGPRARPRLTAERCDLSPAQRWQRLGPGVLVAGHDFYQFAEPGRRQVHHAGQRLGRPGHCPPGSPPATRPGPTRQLLAFLTAG